MMTLSATSAWGQTQWTLQGPDGEKTITDGTTTLNVSVDQNEKTITIGTNGSDITASTLNLPSNATSGDITYKITAIANNAFADCASLQTVTFEEGEALEKIGMMAFAQCKNLTSIELPNSVTELGMGVFYGCTVLTSATLPDNIKEIPINAFNSCKKLESITIPASVEKIGTAAFGTCSALESITIPASVKTIGQQAFIACEKLLSITYMGGTEPTIGDKAFSLKTSSTIPIDGRELILPNAKPGSTWNPVSWGITGEDKITRPSNKFDPAAHTLTVGETVIKNVTADNDKLTIGDNTGLTLTELILPDSVYDESGKAYAITTIAENAFTQCTALAKVEIPATVKTIGNNAFLGCTALTDITYKGTTEPTIGNGAFYLNGSAATVPNRKIHLPNGEGEPSTDWHYDQWGVASVSDLLFAGWEYDPTAETLTKGEIVLNNVTAADNKLTIGDNKDLSQAKLSLPNEAKDQSGKTYTITAIARSAFENTALTGIKFPSTLKEIGSYAFHSVTQLTSIEIPASVEKIGSDAFMDAGLTSVTFVAGDNLKTIGYEAFNGTQLERLILPEGVETIGEGAFGRCEKLKSVTIPESVTKIDKRVFRGCKILTDVTYLGKTEPEIGERAFNFDYDNAIVPGRKVTIPNGEGDPSTDWHPEKWGVASVNDLVFAGWEYDSAKKTLTMDKTVINNVTADGKKLTIGENSALDLSELSLPDSAKDVNPAVTDAYAITAIAAGAFKQNTKLTKITLPATVTKIGDNAFAGTITELHLLHETPDNLEMHVSGLDKSSCVVYVPKDKLKNFHTTDPYWSWNGFPYILEEGGELVAIKYEDKDGNAWAPDKSLLSEGSLFATKAPVGQTFVYVLNFASEDSSLVFRSKDNPAPNVFTSKNDTILTLATNEKKDWTLIVGVLRPIKENTVTTEIVIKSDNEYEKDGEDDSYNGTITATTTPKLTIGAEGETKEINITMKEVKVEKADETAGETTVQSGTTATLTLEGTNSLGTLNNEGTLTLTATDRTKIKLPGIKITNNKVFRDSTGIITEVEGTALLKVNAIPSQPVETGSTVTLKAKVTSNAGMKMDYKWLRLGNDGKWTDYPSAPAPAANFSIRAATTTEEYENELTVKAEDKGEFRCEITAATADESSITMLTVFTAVTLNEPAPDPVTYSVILPEVEGAKTDPQANTYWITEGDSFSFTLTLDTDYDQSKPVVKAGDKVIEPNADGKYVIESIYEDITISITGIEKNTTVGNAEVEGGEAKVWSDNGVLHIYTPIPARVRVINFIGSPVKDLGTVNGDTQTTLPKGSYIIVIGDSTKKIAL